MPFEKDEIIELSDEDDVIEIDSDEIELTGSQKNINDGAFNEFVGIECCENIEKVLHSTKFNQFAGLDASKSICQEKPINCLENFLLICESKINNTEYEKVFAKKIAFLRYQYKKNELDISSSLHFQKLFEDNANIAMKSVKDMIISFKEVFLQIKKYSDFNKINVKPEHLRELTKLEKTMKLLFKKIKRLEKAEVDFETEEDSSYLQLARYIDKLGEVKSIYCELLNSNQNSQQGDGLADTNLNFAYSKYKVINVAISEKFKANKMYPTDLEMKALIMKVSSDNNLNLTANSIDFESKHCIMKLRELLQNRRRKDLYDSHCMYINRKTDPALRDLGLRSKLNDNYKDCLMKLGRVCNK